MNSRTKVITIIIGLFCVAFMLRAVFYDFDRPFHYDEEVYHIQASQLLEKKQFVNEYNEITAWRTPGFPLILAVVYKFGGTVYAARWILIILSSLSVVGVYLLAFLLFKENSVALIAGIIQALLPTDIRFSGSYYCEESAAFLLVLAFLLAIFYANKATKQQLLGAAAAGLLIGAAIITRGYLLFAILALPLFFLTYKKSTKVALVCLLVSMIIPLSWMIRNALAVHSFTLSTETFQAIWHGNNSWARGSWNSEWSNENSEQKAYLREKYPNLFTGMSEVERANIFRQESINEITGNPKRILWLAPRKIAVFLIPWSFMKMDWVFLFCLPLSVIGFFLILKSRQQRHFLWLLAFPIFCVATVCLITLGDPRFRHPVNFCFVILASYCLVRIAGKFMPNFRAKAVNE